MISTRHRNTGLGESRRCPSHHERLGAGAPLPRLVLPCATPVPGRPASAELAGAGEEMVVGLGLDPVGLAAQVERPARERCSRPSVCDTTTPARC